MGYFDERRERAVKRAEKRSAENFARKCLEMGKFTLKDIATATGLTLKRVKKLAETL